MEISEFLNIDPLLKEHSIMMLMAIVSVWILVIISVLIDLWDGIVTARRLKERIHSHKLRVTIDKVCEYWRLLLLGALLDFMLLIFPVYAIPVVTLVLGFGLVIVEMKSIREHKVRCKSKTLDVEKVVGMILSAANDRDAKAALEKAREYFEVDEPKVSNKWHKEGGNNG